MRKVEFVYENYVKDLCSSVKNVVIDEFLEEIIDDNTGEIIVVFQDENKLVMKVYASKDITVYEIQRLISAFKFFNINLEYIKYNTIPFTNLCLIEFEVCSNEKYSKYD